MKASVWHWAFGAVALAELISQLAGIDGLHLVAKPLLMPLLAAAFHSRAAGGALKRWVLAAFVFSWAGDVLLMSAKGFLPGLGAFLLAQLCYIRAFALAGTSEKPLWKRRPWAFLPLLAYTVSFCYLLLPGLDAAMQPAVFFYACALTGMAAAALNRQGRVGAKSFRMVFAGAVLFVVSDSLIAVSRFLSPFTQSGFLIMLTYIAAQFLIMKGMLAYMEKKDTAKA